MRGENEILKDFILSISSLNDEEVKNLKQYSPITAQIICKLISDYIEYCSEEKDIDKIFIKRIINKLI